MSMRGRVAAQQKRGTELRQTRAFDEIRELAADACGVDYKRVAVVGRTGDWDYVFPAPVKADEVGTAYGRHALTLVKNPQGLGWDIAPIPGV